MKRTTLYTGIHSLVMRAAYPHLSWLATSLQHNATLYCSLPFNNTATYAPHQ